MPVEMQYLQLITDKTNAADPSNRVFNLNWCYSDDKNTKLIDVSQILSITGKQ